MIEFLGICKKILLCWAGNLIVPKNFLRYLWKWFRSEKFCSSILKFWIYCNANWFLYAEYIWYSLFHCRSPRGMFLHHFIRIWLLASILIDLVKVSFGIIVTILGYLSENAAWIDIWEGCWVSLVQNLSRKPLPYEHRTVKFELPLSSFWWIFSKYWIAYGSNWKNKMCLKPSILVIFFKAFQSIFLCYLKIIIILCKCQRTDDWSKIFMYVDLV